MSLSTLPTFSSKMVPSALLKQTPVSTTFGATPNPVPQKQAPSLLAKLALGAALLLGGVGLVKTFPQHFILPPGNVTADAREMPAPPPEVRLELNTPTINGKHVVADYITWDDAQECFTRKQIQYARLLISPTKLSPLGYTQQAIEDNHVFANGIRIDQTNKFILLPNGDRIDGPTGIHYRRRTE
jgi:hypothetical protein